MIRSVGVISVQGMLLSPMPYDPTKTATELPLAHQFIRFAGLQYYCCHVLVTTAPYLYKLCLFIILRHLPPRDLWAYK